MAFYRIASGLLGYFVRRTLDAQIAVDLTADDRGRGLRLSHGFRDLGDGSASIAGCSPRPALQEDADGVRFGRAPGWFSSNPRMPSADCQGSGAHRLQSTRP